MSEQLPLKIQFDELLTFDNFIIGPNEQGANYLHNLGNLTQQSVFIWGSTGTGKTHLVQALYHHLMDIGKQPGFIDTSEAELKPDVLDGFEYFDYVILDGIENVIGNTDWQEKLFHLYNRLMANNSSIVLTSRNNPNTLESILPDLSSRLLSGLVFQLHELTEEGKKEALIKRAEDFGLVMTNEVLNYWMTHCSRDMHEIFTQLRNLDNASMAHKRRLTVPFLKQVLEI